MRGGSVYLGLALGLACSVAGAQTWKAEIGYSHLQARLGGATPTGDGISVTQVEGSDANMFYHPDTGHTEFSGKTFIFECTTCNNSGASFHATTVGTYLYGNTSSIAPGITDIGAEEVNNWIITAIRYNDSSNSPASEPRRIENHAWIATAGSAASDNQINRRFDLMLHRDAVVASVGVNNNVTPMPALLSSSYNAIAVGRSSGASSHGPVVANLDGAGRVKPDLVVPTTATSWGTGVVSAAVSILLEAEEDLNVLSSLSAASRRRGRALLAKAMLLEGCTRDEFSCQGGWRKGFAVPGTDGSVPLDYRFGAGELHIDHSHRILSAHPQQSPSGSSLRTTTGWNFTTINNGSTHQYFFEVSAGGPQREFSVLATWNRMVSAPPALTPSLANIDLRLFNATGFTKGSQVDQSVSSLDNVELIITRPIPPGRYVFELTTNATWEYAVAWDLRSQVPPDINYDGHVDASDVALFKSCATRSGVPTAPNCAHVDFDADGDADVNDFSWLQRCYSGSCTVVDPACYAP